MLFIEMVYVFFFSWVAGYVPLLVLGPAQKSLETADVED